MREGKACKWLKGCKGPIRLTPRLAAGSTHCLLGPGGFSHGLMALRLIQTAILIKEVQCDKQAKDASSAQEVSMIIANTKVSVNLYHFYRTTEDSKPSVKGKKFFHCLNLLVKNKSACLPTL